MLTEEELIDREEKKMWIEMQKEREHQIIETTDSVISAKDLYDKGFNIFPVEYGTKETYRKWGFLQNARLPENVIEDIFGKQNIAVLTGKLSCNLFVIDCDDEATFKTLREKLDQSNLAKWVVATSRGGHFWFLSQDGEVENITLEKHLEVWGSKHYIIAPPSLNADTGVIYFWLKRDGYLPPELAEEDIHKIFPYIKVHTTLRTFLPTITHEVLVNRNSLGYHSNSEAEYAAICALVRYGWDDESILELFQEYQPPHFQNRKSSEKWLQVQMIRPARKMIKLPPHMNKIKSIVSWVVDQTWDPRTGNTDKFVFLACCKRAMYENPDCFRATKREIAKMTNVTDKTASCSLDRLVEFGYLQPIKKDASGISYQRSAGNHYQIKTDIQDSPSNVTAGYIIGVMSSIIKNHDVWNPRALGKSALNIYEYLLLNKKRKNINELVDETRKSKPVIKRALSKLKDVGLANEESGTWQIMLTNEEYLDKIAIDFDVFGIGERREEQRQRDRERQAWNLFRISLAPKSQN